MLIFVSVQLVTLGLGVCRQNTGYLDTSVNIPGPADEDIWADIENRNIKL